MDNNTIFPSNSTTPQDVLNAVHIAGETPFYLYDARLILARCDQIRKMLPERIGFQPRYAMKANSTKAILQLIAAQGFVMDASSLNEVRRAVMAGIHPEQILLTTQEVPAGKDREELNAFMLQGMKYNACSLRQLELVGELAAANQIPLSVRIHPGEGGTGESLSRDTANPYASFGIHISQFAEALSFARQKHVIIDQLHQHIGSGGSPDKWQAGIDRIFNIIEGHLDLLPDLKTINLGGGLKVSRMPDEEQADPAVLGLYAAEKVQAFLDRNGRTLSVEVEPGTYLVANAGIMVTRVIDIKFTGKDGYNFLIADGGMEMNARPLMYGSRHPFALVSAKGEIRSTEVDLDSVPSSSVWIPVGRCCETGDAHSISADGRIVPRKMASPQIDDFLIVGGCGAYGASMSPFNYNSHTQAPEVMKMPDGSLRLIRKAQSLQEVTQNEIGLN